MERAVNQSSRGLNGFGRRKPDFYQVYRKGLFQCFFSHFTIKALFIVEWDVVGVLDDFSAVSPSSGIVQV